MTVDTPKLSVKGANKSFEGRTALAPSTLSLQPGEFVSLVGPSGCGKSTLFNLVSGLLRPDDGRIEIDGDAFLIQGEPVRDRERLVWTVNLRPA